MSFLSTLSDADRGRCFDVLTAVAHIRTELDLLSWLRGDLQHFLPHDILLAAWGDFRRCAINHHVISPLRHVRTANANAAVLVPRMLELFAQWSTGGRQAYATPAERLRGALTRHPLHDPLRCGTSAAPSAVVHGLRDVRSGQDCLYIVLSCDREMLKTKASEAMTALVPHIDMAMRQVAQPAGTCDQSSPSAAMSPTAPQISIARHTPLGVNPTDSAMTGRELQIMQWVEMGKTNQEIGTILDISTFTVKNHLQRIFKKLDVYNRAQAVSRLKNSHYAHG